MPTELKNLSLVSPLLTAVSNEIFHLGSKVKYLGWWVVEEAGSMLSFGILPCRFSPVFPLDLPGRLLQYWSMLEIVGILLDRKGDAKNHK